MERIYKKDLVNILVPCYNGGDYIERFIKSLAVQTYKDIELIIVNDGSTDNSEELILSATETFLPEKIKLNYIFQENKGIGGAINTALKHITGEFFVWFNIDDILTEDCIELMAVFLDKNKEYDLVRPNVFIVDEQDTDKVLCLINDKNPDANKEYLFNNALEDKNFTFGCSMIRTRVFDEVNPEREIYESRQGQNWQILLPVLYKHKSGYINKPLYSVVNQRESTSRVHTPEKRIKQLFEYENIIVNTLRQMNMPEKERNGFILNVKNRYAHSIFDIAWFSGDFNVVKSKFIYLKENKLLNKTEKGLYRKRFFRVEYWLYLKHRILK